MSIGQQNIGPNGATALIPGHWTGTCTIRNVGHVTVWIGDDRTVTPESGTPISVGEELTLSGRAGLYACRLSYSGQYSTANGLVDAPAPLGAVSWSTDDAP